MASSFEDKRNSFVQSLKVDTSKMQQTKAQKQGQFSSNNSNSSGNNSNRADAPVRQRSLDKGRGEER